MTKLNAAEQWLADCKHWRGRALTGQFGHYCEEWDELPVDETTPEWPCSCDLGATADKPLKIVGEIREGEDS